ncbi:hypothetical protein EPN52_03945 [bacterium]|nr:MAG: hypothetical protein EPN52_03945 [bacterium]
MRKFASVAALMAFSIAFATPTFAAVTKTGTVNITWNTSATASLSVNTNYVSTGLFSATTVNELTTANGGTGTCTASSPAVAGTDNFGTISPDFTNPTDCTYQNAVNLQVATNSVNWNVTEALGANPAGGYLLCALPNPGTSSWPLAATGAAMAATVSTRTSTSVSGGACAAGDALTTTALTVATGTGAYASGSPANLGEDFELIVPANGATGSQTPVMNITLTAN